MTRGRRLPIRLISEAAHRVRLLQIELPDNLEDQRIGESVLANTKLGDTIVLPAVATHPEGQRIAVAMPGAVEVWDDDFQIITRVPGINRAAKVIPLEMQDPVAVLTVDGQGHFMNPGGERVGHPIQVYLANSLVPNAMSHQSIWEAQGLLMQASKHMQRWTWARPLSKFGLDHKPADRFLFGYGPRDPNQVDEPGPAGSEHRPNINSKGSVHVFVPPHRQLDFDQDSYTYFHPENERATDIALDPRTGLVVLGFDDGELMVCPVGQEPQTIQLADPGKAMKLTLSHDAETLFVACKKKNEVCVEAYSLPDIQPRWSQTIPSETGQFGIIQQDQNNLLLSLQDQWITLNPITGQINDNRKGPADTGPPGMGFAGDTVVRSSRDGSLYSRLQDERIEPIGCWNDDLSLRWISVHTLPAGQVTLAANGRVISAITTDDFPAGWTVPRHGHWNTETGNQEISLPLHDATDSFSVLRYHEDARVTMRPSVPMSY